MWRKMLMLGGLLALAGCEQQPVETPKHFAPLALWRAEVVEDAAGRTGVIDICANQELVGSFSRVTPSINGQACAPYGEVATDTAAEHVGRCEAGGMRYGVYLTTKRVSADDFTVRFALQPLQAAGGKVVQSRRYHRVGNCPAGWTGGDQGPPGGAPTSNLMTGQRYAAKAG